MSLFGFGAIGWTVRMKRGDLSDMVRGPESYQHAMERVYALLEMHGLPGAEYEVNRARREIVVDASEWYTPRRPRRGGLGALGQKTRFMHRDPVPEAGVCDRCKEIDAAYYFATFADSNIDPEDRSYTSERIYIRLCARCKRHPFFKGRKMRRFP